MNQSTIKSSRQSGQGLVEYLILVSLIAIGSVAILRTLSQNIKYNYARVAEGLGAEVEGNKAAAKVGSSQYDRKDLKNFFNGARSNVE